jgi:ATP-binding protein involved in chromosome partitioning
LLSHEAVLLTLSQIKDPDTGINLKVSEVVKALTVTDEEIKFIIELNNEVKADYQMISSETKKSLENTYPQAKVTIILTSHKSGELKEMTKPAPQLKIGRHPTDTAVKLKPPNVKKLIAVGSGKGGVGKSTVSANLAIALTKLGFSVGLLDADIYGPSQPKVMGINGKPKTGGDDNKTIIPLSGYGVTVMSMGFLVPPKEAIIWRGPMLMGAIQQFVSQVAWGDLDILLIDLPPGTGDVQLTLAQKCQLDGAVIVSTPQDIALIDARKAMHMFYKLGIPIVGMIENMSTFVCKNCGHEEHLFGKDGAKNEAAKAGISFLGKIPLDLEIRKSADTGYPVVAQNQNSNQSKYFKNIAKNLSSEIKL